MDFDDLTQTWQEVGAELEEVAERAIMSLIQDQRERGVSYVFIGGETPVLVMVAVGLPASRMLPIVQGLFDMTSVG